MAVIRNQEGRPSEPLIVFRKSEATGFPYAAVAAIVFILSGVHSSTVLAAEDGSDSYSTPGVASQAETNTSAFLESFQIQPPGHVKPLRFGGLLTFAGFVGRRDATATEAGFDITDARLLVEGELEKGFGYLAQAEFTKSTPLLDLVINWKPAEHGFRASAGYFRSPFSAEQLIPDPQLDFTDRSQIVNALAPSRQIGIQVDQLILGKALIVHAGVFNGNGLDANDDDRFLYMLRLDGASDCGEDWKVSYGINAAHSDDENAEIGIDDYTPLNGKRWIAGGDMRATRGPFFFSAEALWGFFDDETFRNDQVWGYQASAGWQVTDLVQLLARYDAFHAGDLDRAQDRDFAIASVNFNFTKIISLQFELRVPTRGVGPSPGGIVNLNATF